MELNEILSRCDHTLLAVGATSKEIEDLCDEAIEYGCASVCIPACHVKGAKSYVGEQMKICTVIGFPNGYSTTASKAYEAADAVKTAPMRLTWSPTLPWPRTAIGTASLRT